MNVKILLPPLLIVIIISFCVWMVYPAYTNGVDGLAEKLAEKKVEQAKLDKIKEKKNNIEMLSAKLKSDTERKNIIFQYLPETMKEEEIIDNLNYLASKEEVSILTLSVSQPAAAVEEVPAPAPEVAADAVGAVPVDPTLIPVAPKPNPRIFSVNYSVIGAYDNIKSLVDKIYKLERFNEMSSLEITKPELAEGQSANDLLSADMVFNFNLYPKVKNTSNIEQITFPQASFNMKLADEIRNAKSTDILGLVVDQKGKTNPFMP